MNILSSSVHSLVLLASLTVGISSLDTTAETPSLRGSGGSDQRGLIVSRGRSPRIINGSQVRDPSRYPYFALMNGNGGLCGAVLISKRFVLTAAHCVGSDNDFEVGIISNTGGSSSVTDYPYKTKISHPSYNSNNVDNDIALYELEQDVSEDLQYIRLEQNPVSSAGTPLTVIGFGDTNPSDAIEAISDHLMQATVDYVPNTQCREAYNGAEAITPGMLCAFEEGTDSCSGDSGGPLFRKGNSPEGDALVGLVSWGYECGGDTPGVYTRISTYYDWIVESMCSMNPSKVPDYVTCSNTGGGGGGGGGDDNNGDGSSGDGSDDSNNNPSTIEPSSPFSSVDSNGDGNDDGNDSNANPSTTEPSSPSSSVESSGDSSDGSDFGTSPPSSLSSFESSSFDDDNGSFLDRWFPF